MCQANIVYFLVKLQSEKQAYLQLFLFSNVGVKSRAVFIQNFSDTSRGSSRKYEPSLFPIITEQQDSNL